MPRFFAPPSQWSGEEVVLEASEARHACDVLRLREGDELEVFDGEGRRARGRLLEARRGGVRVRVGQPKAVPASRTRVTLVQALPKGQLIEWIIEKATELGVSCIVPVVSARSVTRVDPRESEKKREKWRRVALEACKQCGQDWIPEVACPTSLEIFLRTPPVGIEYVASLRPGTQRVSGVMSGAGAPDKVAVFVGPEGDFTPHEYEALELRGVRAVSLGPRILRTETAAISLLSVLGEALGV